jgi:hypothetical protein
MATWPMSLGKFARIIVGHAKTATRLRDRFEPTVGPEVEQDVPIKIPSININAVGQITRPRHRAAKVNQFNFDTRPSFDLTDSRLKLRIDQAIPITSLDRGISQGDPPRTGRGNLP